MPCSIRKPTVLFPPKPQFPKNSVAREIAIFSSARGSPRGFPGCPRVGQGWPGVVSGPPKNIFLNFFSRFFSVARGCPRMVWGCYWCILSAICVRLGAFGRDFGSISLRNRVWAGFRGGHLGAKMVKQSDQK